MADEVQFQSPTTGKIQAVSAEHWDEALKAGYKPVSHTIMYDENGNRGMVANAQIPEYGRKGYTVTPKTPFEKKRTEGDRGVINALSEMIPSAPSADITSKEFWIGKPEDWGFNPTGPGTAYSDLTRKLPEDLPTDALVNPQDVKTGPLAHSIGRGIYRAASIFSPLNAEASEAKAERADTSGIGTQAGVNVGLAALPVAKEIIGSPRQAIASRMYDTGGALKPSVKTGAQVGGAVVGGALGAHNPYTALTGAAAGYKYGPSLAEAIFPRPPQFPGAPLPSAEDFYSNRGAEINAMLRRQPEVNAISPAGAPFPSVDEFYANEGKLRMDLLRQAARRGDVNPMNPFANPERTGPDPFEPVILENQAELDALNRRKAILKNEAQSAGLYSAARGKVGRKFDYQERIGKDFQ